MRWVGSTGTIITNPDGSIGLFLNGSFAADGDSDAFNQVFYASSTDGEHWTTPVSVVSTDYTFADSVAQDNALSGGQDTPLGIHAYYSGRAYNPTIVPNGDGTLTMLFSGYRTPGSTKVGSTPIGTNPAAQYSPNPADPLLYRNILVATLTPESCDPATTTTSLVATRRRHRSASRSPTRPRYHRLDTGTADRYGGLQRRIRDAVRRFGPPVSSPDVATCAGTYDGSAVTATYSGDVDDATSTSTLDFVAGGAHVGHRHARVGLGTRVLDRTLGDRREPRVGVHRHRIRRRRHGDLHLGDDLLHGSRSDERHAVHLHGDGHQQRRYRAVVRGLRRRPPDRPAGCAHRRDRLGGPGRPLSPGRRGLRGLGCHQLHGDRTSPGCRRTSARTR